MRRALAWLLRYRFSLVDVFAASVALGALHDGVSPLIVFLLWFLATLAATAASNAIGVKP